MANLEACPTCGNQTSENAETCPACGESLGAGWATAVRLAEEKSAVTLKKSKRKKRLFGVVAVGLVAALFVVVGVYADYRMKNLKEIDPAAYQNRMKELETLVAKVPAAEFDQNISLYKELRYLNPENKRYADKLSYYREQKTAAAKAPKAKKGAVEAVAAVAAKAAKAKKAAGETTIGRWCDRMLPNMPKYNRTMAIVITDGGKVVLKWSAGDGSSSTNDLREASGGIYEKIGSSTGDKYRIVSSTGNLQLLDNDGLIRVAARLENTPRSNECAH